MTITPGMRAALFWAAFALALAAFLALFADILLPFVAGVALAYLLDPAADALERLGLSRGGAVAIIMGGFVAAVAALAALVLPVALAQGVGLAAAAPTYVERVQQFGSDVASGSGAFRLPAVSPEAVKDSLGKVMGGASAWIAAFLASMLAGGRAVAGILSLVAITPVVALYLLLDWDRMVARVDAWLPKRHAPTIRLLAARMDAGVSGYIRGQAILCGTLAVLYAVALTVTGLKYGLVIGLTVGVLSFIPYVGVIGGAIVALTVAFVQGWPEWHLPLAVAGIFAAGQVLENYFLQPRLVGQSVGIHPVWLMFALIAFASLFGFVGMLIAVPAAAVVKVLVAHALDRYLASDVHLREPDAQPSRLILPSGNVS
jgi:predicted PurR-regulated permease PerM